MKRLCVLFCSLALTPAGAQTPDLGALLETVRQHQNALQEALAQEPGVPRDPPAVTAARPAPNPEKPQPPVAGGRDPFALTPLMLQGGTTAFVSGDAGQLPGIKLRGLARGPDGKSLCLIEVEDGGTYLLQSGETVTVRTGQTSLVLRVKQILPAGVELEAGAAQQVVVR